ncbi:acyl carrier protein [Streptomyces sp. TRM43335]|uniref:Acyl carrier protein n=1 Tax=Streptomyces taklimakanensis TaxID=2569853 RepID=A0A6G2BBF2_9ACTN|nr:phosphopantetheine-binding protein [Streptomyces taklimakanensis]MTE19605.1 acyl carrier protein [Streptomyces taklimakanensis]
MPEAVEESTLKESVQRATVEWVAELLEDPEVGAEDNFLDLGGHSMLALQLGNLAKERFGQDYDLRVLFEGTLADAAADLAARAA